MKTVLLLLAIVVLSVSPSAAADRASDGMMGTNGTDSGGATAGMRGMRSQMMQNPEHLLMMAYHRNVMVFGRALEKAAQQGDTVPREVAVTAVSEMRRSTEQMEKYRAGVVASVPEARRGEMQKMMDEHLINVKTHLRQLEDLTKQDQIPSQEVLKHVQAIFKGCDQMSCGLMGRRGGMPGPGMGRGRGRMGGGCDCPQCQSQKMMPQHRKMMQDMTQKLKAQDAELIQRVDKMKRASKDKKVDQLADIVSLLVQQRAAMTAQMEKMQRHTMTAVPYSHGPASPPPPDLNSMDNDEDDSVDIDDTDTGYDGEE